MAKKTNSVPEQKKASSVVLRNWDDWFNMCGTMVQDLQEYESCMEKYYFELQHKNTVEEQQIAQKEYQSKHKKRFFEDEKLIPSWMYKSLFVSGLIGILLGFVLVFILIFSAASKVDMGFGAYVASKGHTVGSYVGVRGLLCGLLFGGLFVFG